MVDADLKVRGLLASIAPLGSLVGSRIFAAPSLPAGYTVAQGPCVLFSVRGGGFDYTRALIRPSFQFRAYAQTQPLARQVNSALVDGLLPARTADIKGVLPDTLPVLLEDPDTAWPYVLTFFTVIVANPLQGVSHGL